MLNGYEDRQLTDNEFRILQGVLSTDFHALELLKYIKEEQTKKQTVDQNHVGKRL